MSCLSAMPPRAIQMSGALLSVLLVGAPTASAEEIGVFFNLDTLATSAEAGPGETVTAYVAAFGVDVGFEAYAFSVGLTSGMTLLSSSCPSQTDCVNFGEDDNFLVDLLSCYLEPDPVLLGTFEILVPDGVSDGLVCVGPFRPPSPVMPFPEFLGCDGPQSRYLDYATADPGGVYPPGCAVVNASADTPVGAPTKSWGAVKAQF